MLAIQHNHRRRAALWWCAAVASETALLRMAARAGLLRYALRMVAAAAAAAAVYRLRAAWPLVRAGRLAMYRCRAARHRAVAVAIFVCAQHLPVRSHFSQRRHHDLVSLQAKAPLTVVLLHFLQQQVILQRVGRL